MTDATLDQFRELAAEFRAREETCREMREDMTYDRHALVEDKARLTAKAATWAAAAEEIERVLKGVEGAKI